jgi:hypothetical protein
MNAPDPRRRLARKTKRRRVSGKHKRAFLDDLRKQCRLANEADKRDNWEQFLYLPE